MAERFKRSPKKAFKHAFGTTLRNASFIRNFNKNTSFEKQVFKLDKNDVSVENGKQNAQRKSDKFKKTNDILVVKETNSKAAIIANEDNGRRDAIDEEDEEIRRNVWSDIDDELYIASLIQLRRANNVHNIEKRDTSAYVSDSDISEKVVSSVKLEYGDMWEIEPTDLTECDCLGPPPEFLLPPPPRPPFLQADYYCGDDPIPDLETCDSEPVS